MAETDSFLTMNPFNAFVITLAPEPAVNVVKI